MSSRIFLVSGAKGIAPDTQSALLPKELIQSKRARRFRVVGTTGIGARVPIALLRSPRLRTISRSFPIDAEQPLVVHHKSFRAQKEMEPAIAEATTLVGENPHRSRKATSSNRCKSSLARKCQW
jgi:hypothetical protein